MKHYFAEHGAYRPRAVLLGSLLTFGKELVRLLFVERTVRGTRNLWRGVRDGRKMAKDASWRPMPPLAEVRSQRVYAPPR